MKVRLAEIKDIDQIIKLSEKTKPYTKYKNMNLDKDKLYMFIKNLINKDMGIALVVVKDDLVVGGMLAEVIETYFGNDLVTHGYGLIVDNEYRSTSAFYKLVQAYIKLSKHLGAVDIMLGISSDYNINKTSELYERLGFKKVGEIFSLESA